MDFEKHLEQLKDEEQICQKCGRKIKGGGSNICRRCLIEMSDGSLKKEDFNGTEKANKPKRKRTEFDLR